MIMARYSIFYWRISFEPPKITVLNGDKLQHNRDFKSKNKNQEAGFKSFDSPKSQGSTNTLLKQINCQIQGKYYRKLKKTAKNVFFSIYFKGIR